MLRAPSTAFLLVTSPGHDSIEETLWFRRTLEQSGLPFAGLVVNRVHHDLLSDRDPGDVAKLLRRSLSAELAARVAQNFYDYHALARRDDQNLGRLADELDGRPLLAIPQLDDDVHDIEGLLEIHRYLFASDSERARLIADVVA
jgi:anion-transporting  ArsA/GET3 family ATPase